MSFFTTSFSVFLTLYVLPLFFLFIPSFLSCSFQCISFFPPFLLVPSFLSAYFPYIMYILFSCYSFNPSFCPTFPIFFECFLPSSISPSDLFSNSPSWLDFFLLLTIHLVSVLVNLPFLVFYPSLYWFFFHVSLLFLHVPNVKPCHCRNVYIWGGIT